ncbi:MAG TPA: hypothetical protein VF389_11605 [Woeseiaceae bacterium]
MADTSIEFRHSEEWARQYWCLIQRIYGKGSSAQPTRIDWIAIQSAADGVSLGELRNRAEPIKAAALRLRSHAESLRHSLTYGDRRHLDDMLTVADAVLEAKDQDHAD